MSKVCCFIGHRRIDLTKELEKKNKNVVEDLIINKKVTIFLLVVNVNLIAFAMK